MGNCSFQLRLDGIDIEFGSQDELNSYLRENRANIGRSLSGGKVLFSKSRSKQDEVVDGLEAMSKKVTFMREGHKYEIGGVEYTPVTKAIVEGRNSLGGRFIPEFNLTNWEKEKDAELAAEIDGEGNQKYAPEERREIIKGITSRWEILSTVGTSWHSIAEKFFKGEVTTPNEIVKLIPELIGMDYILQLYIKELTLLKARLLDTHGSDAVFLTEVMLFDEESKIAGTTDLLVIDAKGKIHIYDYKTSYKGERVWSTAKKRTVEHQLATYRQMLRRANYGDVESVNYIPIHLNEIDYDSGVIRDFKVEPKTMLFISEGSDTMENINEILPYTAELKLQDISSNKEIHQFMKDAFNYSLDNKEFKTETVDDVISKLYTSQNGKYYILYKGYGGTEFLEKDDYPEPVLRKHIEKYLVKLASHNMNLPKKFYEFVKYAKDRIANGEKPDWEGKWQKDQDTIDKMERLLNKYINDVRWVPLESDALYDVGIIAFENRKTGEVDFISITGHMLNESPSLLKGKTLLGNFLVDSTALTNGLPETVSNGDIELLKVYAFIKNNQEIFKDKNIGAILVASIDPHNKISAIQTQTGYTLDKQWKLLMKNVPTTMPIKEKDWEIPTANPMETLKSFLVEIFKNKDFIEKTTSTGRISLENHISKLDTVILIEDQIKILGDLQNTLAKMLGYDIKTAVNKNVNAALMLKIISDTILQLGSIPTSIEQDMKNWGNIIGENRYLTNPNNWTKASLRGLVDLIRLAMNNTALRFNDMQKANREMHGDFYKDSNSKTSGAMIKLVGYNYGAFENVFELDPVTKKKTMKFKRLDDKSLTPGEVKYIKTYTDRLRELRIDRIRSKHGENSTEMETFLATDMDMNIPLMKASAMSALRGKNYKEVLKDYIRDIYDPNNIYDDDVDSKINMKHQIEMFNVFDRYDLHPEHRANKLKDANVSEFEMDLEIVMDMYLMAYAKEKEVNKQMPKINALKTFIMMNQYYMFNDIPVTEETAIGHIETVVFGKSMVEGESRKVAVVVKAGQDLVSSSVLGLSFFSGLTEGLTGIFGNITRTLANRYDESFFGLKELHQAGMIVVGDLSTNATSVENTSMCEELNRLYRMSEMDIKQLSHKVGSTAKGLTSFRSHWMYWFNTFPGYMNRMTLFVAQMIKDGVIKTNGAGVISKDSALQMINGKLVYNELLDPRFSEYLSSPDKVESLQTKTWKGQRALYLQIKEDMAKEPAGIKDGKLGRAYTNRERDSMKELSDEVHGQYDTENKIWWQKTAFGKIFMQFKTWATAKRDRWYLKTDDGDKRGRWVMEEDEDGELKPVWKGRIHEGIVQTLLYAFGQAKDTKSFMVWDTLRPDQKSNMVWLLSDLIFLSLITAIIALFSDPKMKTTNPVAYQAVNSLRNSGRDLFIGSTISAFAGDKNPIPIFGFASSVVDDTWGVLTGKTNAASHLADNIGLLRSIRKVTTTASDAVE